MSDRSNRKRHLPKRFVALACALAVSMALIAQSVPASAAPPSISLTASSLSVSPGVQVDLTAGMPVSDAGTVSQEIVQTLDPTKVKLTAVGDIKYPQGWTLSYSTDGSTFSTLTPSTAAAWAAVRAVKAAGTINSQGSEGGYQIATGTANGTAVQTTPATIPASGAGDGYQAFFDPGRTRVFNVFHHSATSGNQVDCHVIATGATCSGFPFKAGVSPRTGQYSVGRVVGTKMWIAGYKNGTTAADDAVGFYCVDLSAVLSTGGSPAQCATSFVPLATGTEVNVGTSFGRASGNDLGLNEIRSVDGVSTAGTFSETRIWASLASNGKIICLDTATGSACPAMPSNGWPTAVKGWKLDSSTIGGENTSMVISNGRIYVEGSSSTNNSTAGTVTLACMLVSDPSSECPGFVGGKNLGSVSTAHRGDSMLGNLVELPAADGTTAGVCLLGDTRAAGYRSEALVQLSASSETAVPCWDSMGNAFTGPATLSTMVTSAFSFGFVEYQQPLRRGTRIYWGNGVNFTSSPTTSPPRVFCWDASGTTGSASGAPCGAMSPTGYFTDNYTVTPDPVIDNCMWVTRHEQPNLVTYNMVDNVLGCSSVAPTIATFSGNVLVPRMACTGDVNGIRAWKSFNLTSPVSSSNFTAKLTVKDADGNPIAGWQQVPISAGTPLDLSLLSPAASGLSPAFSVEFNVTSGSVASATAQLMVVGDAPQLCLNPTVLTACPTGSGPLVGLQPSSMTVDATGSTTDSSSNTTTLVPASTSIDISAPTAAQCGSLLSGRAGDASLGSAGGPASGVTVSLLDSSGAVVLVDGSPVTAVTDSLGNYSFGYLFPGMYKVGFPTSGLTTVSSATVVSGATGTTTGTTTASSGLAISNVAALEVGSNAVVNGLYTVQLSAANDSSSGPMGAAQTVNVLSNDNAGTGRTLTVSAVALCAPNEQPPNCTHGSGSGGFVVEGQGEYTVDSTGAVTFTPCSGANTPVMTPACSEVFTGQGDAVTYQVTDGAGTSSATYTPTVVPTPTVTPDAQTGAFDVNQTYTPASNDTAGLGTTLDVTSVRLCSANATAPFTSNNCSATSVTTADGVYSLDTTTGTVTFDPANTFSGVATVPVNYVAADALGQYSSSSITPTVTPPGASAAIANTTSGVVGASQSVNLLTNDTTPSGVTFTASSARLCAPGVSAPNCVSTTVDVSNVGTYTVSNGTVTFTPCTSAVTSNCASGVAFTGTPTALGYQVSDSLSRVVNSTYTPTVVPPPTANADVQTGAFDVNQTYTPASNDTAGLGTTLDVTSVRLCSANATAPFTSNNCSATSVTTADGVYSLDTTTGTVTFDPANTFSGVATVPVNYVAADALGQYSSSSITPTVTPPGASAAIANTTSGVVGASQSVNLLTNDTTPSGVTFTASSARLCAPGTSAPNCVSTTVDVPNVGTYSVTNGTVTFTPCTSAVTANCTTGTAFTGTPTPMGYQVSDSLSRVVNSTYTPTVVPPPTASGDGSQGVKGQPQTIALITNDVPGDGVAPLDPTTIRLCDSSETAPNCTRQSLTISGEGTYTINPSGTVTFTPDPDFVGSSTPQRYVVADVLGQVTDATIQPNVVPPPAPITADDSETGPADTPMTIDPLVNDSAGTLPAGLSGDVNLVRSSLRLCDRNELAPNCTATQLTTADGTYTVDTATGFVTFTPRQGFSGVVTQPVTYQIANDWTGPSGIGIATAVITVIIDPAAPPVVPPTLPLAETTSVGLPATGADSVVLALWGVVILGLGGLLMVIHQRAQRNNESV